MLSFALSTILTTIPLIVLNYCCTNIHLKISLIKSCLLLSIPIDNAPTTPAPQLNLKTYPDNQIIKESKYKIVVINYYFIKPYNLKTVFKVYLKNTSFLYLIKIFRLSNFPFL